MLCMMVARPTLETTTRYQFRHSKAKASLRRLRLQKTEESAPRSRCSPCASMVLQRSASLINKEVQQTLERRQGVIGPSVTHSRAGLFRIRLPVVVRHRRKAVNGRGCIASSTQCRHFDNCKSSLFQSHYMKRTVARSVHAADKVEL